MSKDDGGFKVEGGLKGLKYVRTISPDAAATPDEPRTAGAEAFFEGWAERMFVHVSLALAGEIRELAKEDKRWVLYALKETGANLKRLFDEADQIHKGFGLKLADALAWNLEDLTQPPPELN